MPAWWHLIYFSAVILAFQFGWAIVQVTHLAMIPEMSRNQKDRTELTAMRYSASVISNVIVFVVTWAVLRANRVKSNANIGPEDAYRFRVRAIGHHYIGIPALILYFFPLPSGHFTDSNARRPFHDRVLPFFASFKWLRYSSASST